ncbi:MAG TPA: hypothetical protein VMW15_07615 [Terracidiphilus sp.]|nr:hypothetical protein [Terracidiphilus sp.]HUX43720.1 hypothetical protein [Terracidiphilus sp.]
MIVWIIAIITAILLVFVIWRKASKSFRERCEEPKFLFLQNLGIQPPQDQSSTQTTLPQEDNHDPDLP